MVEFLTVHVYAVVSGICAMSQSLLLFALVTLAVAYAQICPYGQVPLDSGCAPASVVAFSPDYTMTYLANVAQVLSLTGLVLFYHTRGPRRGGLTDGIYGQCVRCVCANVRCCIGNCDHFVVVKSSPLLGWRRY